MKSTVRFQYFLIVTLLLSILGLMAIAAANMKIASASIQDLQWAAQASGTPQNLLAVTCPNTNTVWAVGTVGTVVHTADGGETWEAQPVDTDVHLYDAIFINDSKGWAVGEQGTILYTENGGSSWISQTSGITRTLRGIFFLDDMVGWAVGDDAILRAVQF